MDKKFTCTRCEKEFKAGNWMGCFGDITQRHAVASKNYFAINDELQICWRADQNILDPTGQGRTIHIPQGVARFMGGQYATTDPEEQMALDKIPYLQTEEQYIESRTKPEDKVARQRQTISEQKSLIENLKQQLVEKEGKKEVAAVK